jgi:hypothetical protein
MMQLQERPPLVRFEFRAIENRTRSLAEGRYVADDVAYAIITPAGSKDEYERVAQEWIESIAERARKGSFNPEWARHFRESYKAWQEGNALPEFGTPLKTWPCLSPARIEMYLRANVRTVEDLAALTEEGIKNCGMGARGDKQTAQNWLEQAKTGATAGQLSALQTENTQLRGQVDELTATVRAMAAELKEMRETRPRGRPRKVVDDDPLPMDEEAA